MTRGPEGIKSVVKTFVGAFPDLETTLEVDLSSGEKVVTRWIARGTHTGAVTTLANLQVVDGTRSPRRYGKAGFDLLLAA